MHVLTVIAHPDPDSFTYQVLEKFSAGVLAAGHTHETADLYRENFNPVMTKRDLQQFQDVPMPDDVLREQARIERCDAMCWIFPMWWWGMPSNYPVQNCWNFELCNSLVLRNLEPSRPRVARKAPPMGEVGACQSDGWLGKTVC